MLKGKADVYRIVYARKKTPSIYFQRDSVTGKVTVPCINDLLAIWDRSSTFLYYSCSHMAHNGLSEPVMWWWWHNHKCSSSTAPFSAWTKGTVTKSGKGSTLIMAPRCYREKHLSATAHKLAIGTSFDTLLEWNSNKGWGIKRVNATKKKDFLNIA